MSQNTIISVVLIILAIIFGVYFINSEPVAKTVDYSEGSANQPKGTAEEGPVEEEAIDVAEVVEPAPEDPESGPAELLVEDALDTAIVAEEVEMPAEESATLDPEDTGDDIVIVDDAEELTRVEYTYKVVITGARTSLSKAFSIVVTNTEGRKEDFTQAKLEDGVYDVKSENKVVSFSINADGYAPVLKEVPLIVKPATSTTIEVALEPLAGFTGNVKSFNGKAVGGAVIKLSKGSFKKRSYADARGNFSFTDLSSGEYELSIVHPQFDSKKMTASLSKGELKEVVVKLNRNAVLSGSLLDGEGKSVKGIKVALVDSKDKTNSTEMTTGVNGEFRFEDIAEGKYALRVVSLKGQLDEKLSFKKNVVISRNFKLTPPPSISGVIVNVEGKPVSGVKLFTFDDKRIIECESKKNGRFVLPLTKKGKYRILTSSKKVEINNNVNLYSPGTKKIVLQVLEKKYLKGKVQSPSGIRLDRGYVLKIKNKRTGREKKVIIYDVIKGEFSIPMSLFRFTSKEDRFQLIAISKDFGRGESLSFKFGKINLDDRIIITLGD